MKGTWNTTIKSVCYVVYEKAFDHVDQTNDDTAKHRSRLEIDLELIQ